MGGGCRSLAAGARDPPPQRAVRGDAAATHQSRHRLPEERRVEARGRALRAGAAGRDSDRRRRAEALLALGRLDAAESACQRASRLARQSDDRLEFAVAERVAGSIAWARGRPDDALVSWSMAAGLLEQAHERLELGKTYLEL